MYCAIISVQATLNAGLDLKLAVALPQEEEYNDWVAVHVVDFFNRINVIYGTVQDFCTDTSCPMMSGGPKFEYYWADETQKKPQAVSAPTVSVKEMDLFGKYSTYCTRAIICCC